MNIFQTEKDAIAFLGLMAIANKNFDPQFQYADGEPTHNFGLNIFAAIIDNIDGEIIGQQQNSIHSHCNPMYHAEQETLKEAISRLSQKRPRNTETTSVENYYRRFLFNEPATEGNFHVGGTIYTTLEPCPFCTSALLVNRMKRIVYIIPDSKFGNSFGTLKPAYYPNYDMTYGQLTIADNIESDIISPARKLLGTLLEYATNNPSKPGTLILDDMKPFLEECSSLLRELNYNEAFITTGEEKKKNWKMLLSFIDRR